MGVLQLGLLPLTVVTVLSWSVAPLALRRLKPIVVALILSSPALPRPTSLIAFPFSPRTILG